ncbi:PREDICTED: mRNAion factor [Prunus dulcis]|uniref:PREDICTED: mRNAion factor n=2 Tax=Prunus dulcis TaxID=3755 RepID=A0A5E4F2N3_PRUDU|nr:transcription factor GTE7-like [Prunus dulcis]KAI5313841.1 hypothetical protein L3X38_043017 [Prunus dulcis]VVA21982.1 PREDICTED: mRNAion factor [Prunus dulcis]
MASAVLANRNEPNWPQQPRGGGAGAGGFMGKVPFSSSNSNRNPNPNKRQFKADRPDFNDESPAVTQTASDDASSINHHRRSNTNDMNFVQAQYVSFNIASCSRKELVELKGRLLSELDQIRILKNRIEAGDFNPKPPHKKPIGNKKIAGSKRPLPIAHGKESNSNSKRSHLENGNLMKNCGLILSKLMKHKHAWIFNKPVDVVTMGLHDYYDIIKNPMDLGTVKTNLAKGIYSSPFDFAADVRLTFENAMRYNPQGHEVYGFADLLRLRFEELFQPLNEKSGDGFRSEKGSDEELQASSWNHVEPERVPKRETPVRIEKKPELVRPPPVRAPPVQAPVSSSNPDPSLVQSSPVRKNSQVKGPGVKPLKQPKPKAKDPNKREMSMEEKHKLGVGLQSLPQDKMEQVVQIIKKRNGHLKQDGDEIELDIEAVDTETLWELDRLVTNWKKMVSKIKRQALMGNNNSNSNSNIASNRGHEEVPASEKVDVAATTEPKRAKKGEAGDEDVDIGDDMPMSSFPPVEIEKDVGGGHASSDSSSSSSSSSSGSSSSSDSDSGSSSGSDSDDDNAQS